MPRPEDGKGVFRSHAPTARQDHRRRVSPCTSPRAGPQAFHTTPIKALSNQKYNDLVKRHGPGKVGLLTGDNSVNSTRR